MSFDSAGYRHQRFLPASIEDRLVAMFGRATGVVLLSLIALLWLGLASWWAGDPSLTHATSGPSRNFLGPLGAIVSDLMLQMLGFAAAILLLAPMFWGIELAAARRVHGFRTKVAFYPLSVLVLAGALSSLPVSASWPLENGYGGILGDFVFGLNASAFSLINPSRAGAAAGLVLFTAGFSALVHSIGLELKDFIALLRRPARPDHWRETVGTWQNALWTEAKRLRHGLKNALHDGPSLDDTIPWPEKLVPSRSWSGSGPFSSGLHPFSAHEGHTPASSHLSRWPENNLGLEPLPPNPMTPEMPPAAPAPIMGRDDTWMGTPVRESHPSFDDNDTTAGPTDDGDDGSRAIARRFAPHTMRHQPEMRHDRTKPAPHGSPLLRGMTFKSSEPCYQRPSINLLKRPAAAKPGPEFTQTVLRGSARLLEDVLADFGVKGEIKDIKPGPIVTLFEFEPARGIKSSRVIGLADDIARSMSTTAVRVAVVPGRNVIGIELPNMHRAPVVLREILEATIYRTAQAALPLALGKSIGGDPVVADLARMPHLLVAGTTGSGKSVGINAMILSILYSHAPQDCRLLMIDPKMLELSVYNDIPHLLCPVITEPQKAVSALGWVVAEMEERYKRMTKLSVRNIDVYNNRVRNAKKRGERLSRTVHTGFDRAGQAIYECQNMDLETMPYIVVVVDEFADLMLVAGKEIEAAIQRLAQMARAAGIHLIMATQRPSVDVITGTIKANFPTRISFKVTSKIDSRTILNEQGAEQLLGQGDMLYSSGSGQTVRVHGPFVSDEEVEQIARYLRSLGAPQYVEGVTEAAQGNEAAAPGGHAADDDDLYDRAVATVLRDRKASTSYVQRRLSIGYNRAADLIERMELEGVIGPANNVGKRDILAPLSSNSAPGAV